MYWKFPHSFLAFKHFNNKYSIDSAIWCYTNSSIPVTQKTHWELINYKNTHNPNIFVNKWDWTPLIFISFRLKTFRTEREDCPSILSVNRQYFNFQIKVSRSFHFFEGWRMNTFHGYISDELINQFLRTFDRIGCCFIQIRPWKFHKYQ